MNLFMIKNKVKELLLEEDGIGTVELILILVVLIGIVLILSQRLDRCSG